MNVRNAFEEMNFNPVGGGQELTVADAVVAAAPLPARTTHAQICVKTNAVLMAYAADPATGAAGILLPAGTRMTLNAYALAAARFIRAEADKSATIRIEPGTF